MKVYNLGSMNIDYVYSVPHFVRAGETLASVKREIFPGGKGLNQSVALARAGAQVVHGGRVGADGDFLVRILREAGVDVRHIETTGEPTGHAVIQVDESGQNCILLYAGANHGFSEDYIERVLQDAEPGDMLLLQNEVNGLEQMFAAAASRGLQIAFNPSPFREELNELPLRQVRWWLCNEIEGEQLTGRREPEEILCAMRERFPESSTVLTLGEDGCMFADRERTIRQPIFPAEAVDTTAAGDTFTGYFLAMIAGGRDIPAALRIASRAASIAVSRKGASASIPEFAEVMEGERNEDFDRRG